MEGKLIVMNFRNLKYDISPEIILILIIFLAINTGIDWAINQERTPNVQFRRFKFPFTDAICTGEKLRFTFVGTECDHVIWLFDEDEENHHKGNTEFDYAFEYDKNQAPGIITTHRVDAFCKKGDTYKSAMKRLEVFNRMVAGELNKSENNLKLTVKPAIKNLHLSRIAIADYTEGKFIEIDNLSFYLNSENVDSKKNTATFDLNITSSGMNKLLESIKSKEMGTIYKFTKDENENIIYWQRTRNLFQQ